MSDFYDVSQLKDGVYRITSVENVFCDLLVGSEKALLIDTGHGYGDLRSVVKKYAGDKPLIIVNTHGHLDHACGNAQFSEDVYISEKDFELCEKHTSEKARRAAVKSAEDSGGDGALPADFDPESYIVQGTGALVPLNDGDVFDLGGITIRAIASPGHTTGSISFLYTEENWLYVGDATNSNCWLFLRESCGRAVYTATLDKLIVLNPAKVFRSHVAKPGDVDTLRLYKRTAVEADFSKGFPFKSPFAAGEEARVCVVDGMTMDDRENPGFASVVICADF